MYIRKEGGGREECSATVLLIIILNEAGTCRANAIYLRRREVCGEAGKRVSPRGWAAVALFTCIVCTQHTKAVN